MISLRYYYLYLPRSHDLRFILNRLVIKRRQNDSKYDSQKRRILFGAYFSSLSRWKIYHNEVISLRYYHLHLPRLHDSRFISNRLVIKRRQNNSGNDSKKRGILFGEYFFSFSSLETYHHELIMLRYNHLYLSRLHDSRFILKGLVIKRRQNNSEYDSQNYRRSFGAYFLGFSRWKLNHYELIHVTILIFIFRKYMIHAWSWSALSLKEDRVIVNFFVVEQNAWK